MEQVQKIARARQNDLVEVVDGVAVKFDNIGRNVGMELPKWINEFQDTLHDSYEKYYKVKLLNYKFQLVENVDNRD